MILPDYAVWAVRFNHQVIERDLFDNFTTVIVAHRAPIYANEKAHPKVKAQQVLITNETMNDSIFEAMPILTNDFCKFLVGIPLMQIHRQIVLLCQPKVSL